MTKTHETSPAIPSAHTPGPWRIHRVRWRRFTAYRIEEQRNDGETSANARLIAAAPEMLSALWYAVSILESMPKDMLEQLQNILDEDIEWDRFGSVFEKAKDS